MRRRPTRFDEILIVEDNTTAAERRRLAGVGHKDTGQTITVRVHLVKGNRRRVAAREKYYAGSSKRGARIARAAKLIDRAKSARTRPVVVAGTSYGSEHKFMKVLGDRDLPFVVQVRPSTVLQVGGHARSSLAAAELLEGGNWRDVSIAMPDGTAVECSAAKLEMIDLPTGTGRLFAAQIGGILEIHRGTIIGISSFDAPLVDLVRLVAHTRWLRSVFRKEKREKRVTNGTEPSGAAAKLIARANISIARRQDARSHAEQSQIHTPTRNLLTRCATALNTIELFAGAGGMGLGFLLGGGAKRCYRIIYSGEANPIFVETLRKNHRTFERIARLRPGARVPKSVDAVDLRKKSALDRVAATAREFGGAHFLIGGPPCQGFSMANRNSWSGINPHNELVDVFIRYIAKLQPLGFLMENVQGILWTPTARKSVSVVDVIERRLEAAGYVLFPKLLDAVWYGVPQHRTRFFLLGLHRDLGYSAGDFGTWGPFPKPSHGDHARPLVTVREAIADLPRVGNGTEHERVSYSEPSDAAFKKNEFLQRMRSGAQRGVIYDHVTSRHADYVIERYRKIPPGRNWESIREEMTNYTDVTRTHSNIYRRLRWDQPSVTIGHYRKSMLVHPSQHRGLSLREASRLQSFPDWFRFAGTSAEGSAGLVHKQQQLANAVCPLVTKAIAEFILGL